MRNQPLWIWVAGVIIALVVMNTIMWLNGGDARLHTSAIFTGGFLIGMITMYIKLHFFPPR